MALLRLIQKVVCGRRPSYPSDPDIKSFETEISSLQLSRKSSDDQLQYDLRSITALRATTPGSTWSAHASTGHIDIPGHPRDICIQHGTLRCPEDPFSPPSEVGDSSTPSTPPIEHSDNAGENRPTHAQLGWASVEDGAHQLVVTVSGPGGETTLPVDLPRQPGRASLSGHASTETNNVDMSPSAYRDYYRHISSFETGWLVDVAVEAPGSSPRLIGTGPSRDLQHRRVVAPRYWHVPQRVAIDTYTHQSPWISGGLLAEGTYAKVYLALHKPTAQQLAIKVVYIARPLDAHICEALINELKILEKLARLADSAPFLLTPASVDDKWSWTSPAGFLHITTPFCPGGDLFYYQGCLDSEQLIIVLAEVALGIDFLHKHGIVHHDIKPENVFVDAEGHCVLADYGAAKLLNAKAKIERHPSGKFVSTLAYTAPEILKDREYDDAADWWAFGCTILTLLQGRVYFDFADRKQYLRSYMKLLKTLKPTMRAIDGCLDRLIDLVEGLLHPVPAKRLRGKAVFDHDYFKDLWMAVPGPSSTGGSGLEPTMQTWEAIRLRLHKPPFSVIHAVPTDRGTEKSVCKEWPSKYGSDQRYLIAELVKDGLQLPVDDACDAVALYHQSTIG